jgi:hypothetical protein
MGEALGLGLFLEASRVEPREGVGTRAKGHLEVSHGWMAARPVSPPSTPFVRSSAVPAAPLSPCCAPARRRGALRPQFRTARLHSTVPEKTCSLTQRDCLS